MMLVFKSLEKVYTTLIVLFLLTISQQVFSEESPLQPLNTSSPQATFNSFMVEMELIHEFHSAGISQKSYLNSIERVLSCFDLSEIPKADREILDA